jgi:hypothetical protein
VENIKKLKPTTKETGSIPTQLPFWVLGCRAGILPALVLLVSPFSGTDTPVCPPLLRRNPPNLGFSTESPSRNATGQPEASPIKLKFLIANPELEFSLSSIKTIYYNFLIAKK